MTITWVIGLVAERPLACRTGRPLATRVPVAPVPFDEQPADKNEAEEREDDEAGLTIIPLQQYCRSNRSGVTTGFLDFGIAGVPSPNRPVYLLPTAMMRWAARRGGRP